MTSKKVIIPVLNHGDYKEKEAGREWKNNFDENANSQLSLLDQEEEQAPQASQE